MKLDTTKINPCDLLTAEELSTISEDAQAKIKYNAVENWILEEKRLEITQKDITKLGNDISDFIKELK
jgi:hypothetical protein